MTVRLSPAERRSRIIEATLAVMLRKGIAATTVRDVAQEMGSSPGLVHHYFDSMDDLVAVAFEQAATSGLTATREALGSVSAPVEKLRIFFATYVRAEQDWAFQLWLDAWSEAARRPTLQATSQRLNVEWQQLLVEVIRAGLAAGDFTCPDPEAAGWRILSLLDGLALQTVAHHIAVGRDAVVAWSAGHAEHELGLAEGTLG
ncbi:MAG: TetR family transcriptional regulator C-terminal domain-containing protein [Geodermatophilaceae bacterium]|nr:TetR family transcriptional regulator C-terminal domain-containing protein [Geodermatophilaceae bacterium]